MECAVNMSFANRQVILHRIREVFSEVFAEARRRSRHEHGLRHSPQHGETFEKHEVDGKVKELIVHRKGATRASAPEARRYPNFTGDGSAGHYRRQHGNGILSPGRADRMRKRPSFHGPRQRQDHEQARRKTSGAENCSSGSGSARHLRPNRVAMPGWPRKRGTLTRTSTRWSRPPSWPASPCPW